MTFFFEGAALYPLVNSAQNGAQMTPQCDLVTSLAAEQPDTSREALPLETLEIAQALLESHLETLREGWGQSKL
jgi:hypothetical protein